MHAFHDSRREDLQDNPQTMREQKPASPQTGFDPDAFTRALRIAGAALVVAAASTFMLQNWQAGNDLMRYAMLVGQSLLLAAAAYFVGLTVREGRSARTFLALVLATIPVSFAVLGGLVYSQFHLGELASLPHYASWIAPSKGAALLAVFGTLIVLVPLSLVSFTALARKEAKALTLAFVGANLLVLVPLRQPELVSVFSGVALLGLLRLELTRFAVSAQLDTLEGKLARVMPFAPPLIMLGRVFHLYHVGPAFVGGVLLIAAAALWQLLTPTSSEARRDAGAWIASSLGVIGWGLCWFEFMAHLSSIGVSILVLGLPAAAMFFLGALRSAHARTALLTLGTIFALMTALSASAVDRGTAAAFCCIVLGVAVSVWGAAVRTPVRMVAGALVALWGLGLQVWLAVHADNLLRWISLTVVGILLIVGSAYIERNRARLSRFWQLGEAK
ncbi:MAG TPA: hypothetical protein VER96_22280 [Polyangiaceae bacterium]|nr:hypothetical protein [Polyangiaceae bacterium]